MEEARTSETLKYHRRGNLKTRKEFINREKSFPVLKWWNWNTKDLDAVFSRIKLCIIISRIFRTSNSTLRIFILRRFMKHKEITYSNCNYTKWNALGLSSSVTPLQKRMLSFKVMSSRNFAKWIIHFSFKVWIAQRYSAGQWAEWSGVRVPAGVGNFSLHHRVQTCSGAHPASYPMGTRGFFSGSKATGAWSWPLSSI
jgi:hypothetical protein